MGRIPPRRRKAIRIYQPMLRSWIAIMKRPMRDTTAPQSESESEITSAETETGTSAATRGKTVLSKIWHMSDDFHWMSPLPYAHRRGMILAVLVILLALLWPYTPENTYAPSQPQQPTSIPMQADLRNDQGRTTQMAQPEPVQPATTDNSGTWRSYQVQSGQTLAQLFRDNNMAVNDVFSMARVEGDDKPLSTLKTGQEVKIQRDAQGGVTALQVTTDQNVTVTFTRQPDGSFQRSN